MHVGRRKSSQANDTAMQCDAGTPPAHELFDASLPAVTQQLASCPYGAPLRLLSVCLTGKSLLSARLWGS